MMNKLMRYSVEEQRKICQAGFHHLIDLSILTNPKYRPNWHHEIIAQELEKAESGKADWQILILMMPPRHGKSEEASINFPAWYLGRNPGNEIITASYSAELALDFGGKTRTLVDSQIYKIIFNLRLKADDKSKARWRTNEGGGYTSVGIGGAITGRGANILCIDDPIKNKEEAQSKLIRDKHWDWFTSTAYTRLEPNGKVVLTLTRWHLDDLAGRILSNEEFKSKTKVIVFPAIATHDEQFRKKGEALWPERYSLDDLNSIKQAIGPYDWSSLYQQSPILTENQEFNPSWFKPITRSEVEKLNTRKFLTVDTALSDKDGSDYNGFCENYVDQENKWNLSAYRLRLNARDLVDYIFTIHENRGGFEKIGIEKTAYLVGLKPYLESEMKKRNKFLNIVELDHHQTQKEIRIRGLIPRYSNHSINHITGECQDLEEELLNFPKATNDDVSDATAYQLQISEPFKKEIKFNIGYSPISEYEGEYRQNKPLISQEDLAKM